MFATVHNTRLLQFMSPIPEPVALAVDAPSQDWQGRSMPMFPPLSLLNKVIQKLRATQEAEVILIAPWWPSQLWFPHLLRLGVDHPLFFPYHRNLLSQQDQKFISDGKSYHLPQTVKGYRTCLGSVLNRTGKAKVVQHSDMIASMELQSETIRNRIKSMTLGINTSCTYWQVRVWRS